MNISFEFEVTRDLCADNKLSIFDNSNPENKKWNLEKQHYLNEQGYLLISALEKTLKDSQQYKYPYSEIVYKILTLLKSDEKNINDDMHWEKVWDEIYEYQKTLSLDNLPKNDEELAKMGLYKTRGRQGEILYISKELSFKLHHYRCSH